jgi:uncharacterized protein YbjT (DUF2867 family)
MTSCTYHHHRAQCSGGLLKSHRAACQTALRKTAAAVRVVARGMDKLARLFPDAAVEKRPADILDADATLRAVDGCDLVYDCIGLPGDQMHLHPVIARNIAGALQHTKARCVQQMTSYDAGIGQTLAWMASGR